MGPRREGEGPCCHPALLESAAKSAPGSLRSRQLEPWMLPGTLQGQHPLAWELVKALSRERAVCRDKTPKRGGVQRLAYPGS